MDPEIYLANQKIVKDLKLTRLFAILGIVFSSVFILESIVSLIVALLCPPVLGWVLGIIFELAAILLCLLSWGFLIGAFVFMLILAKKVKTMEDSPELLEAMHILKFLQVFIFVCLCANLLVSLLMLVVNVLAFILFII